MNLAEVIKKAAGSRAKPVIINAIVENWNDAAGRYALLRPHRVAHFLAQIAHESGRFSTLVEGGGDSRANRLYDTRTDLGNTPARDGDGALYKGHGLIQLTGKSNHKKFGDIVAARFNLPKGYFVSNPDEAANPKYALEFACAYWEDRKLNQYADANNIEMITRRINGGLNGYQDRLDLYTRFGLSLLDYGLTAADIREFQADHDIVVDGLSGPQTRQTIHNALVRKGELNNAGPNSQGTIPVTPVGGGEPTSVSVGTTKEPRNRGGILGAIIALIKDVARFFGRKTPKAEEDDRN